jgi:RNA polymerase sigma-70 factor (ECF subfamily)
VQVNHAHDSDPSVCFHDAGETFAVVWKRREHVPREATAARMWSFGVARNILRRHHRRRQSRELVAKRAGTDTEPGTPVDPADAAEAVERHAAVHSALRDLPEGDRDLTRLVHWDGFSLVETAALLRINP